MVIVELLSAPAVIAAAPDRVMPRVPVVTVSLTVKLVASTSATLIRLPPVNTKAVSSSIV